MMRRGVVPREDQYPRFLSATLRLRPARRLRLRSLRPLVVFMRARKPMERLRFTREVRFGYAMPMGNCLSSLHAPGLWPDGSW